MFSVTNNYTIENNKVVQKKVNIDKIIDELLKRKYTEQTINNLLKAKVNLYKVLGVLDKYLVTDCYRFNKIKLSNPRKYLKILEMLILYYHD